MGVKITVQSGEGRGDALIKPSESFVWVLGSESGNRGRARRTSCQEHLVLLQSQLAFEHASAVC